MADDRREELLTKPSDQWDAFYSQHSDQFFYDRQWLLKEFEELNMDNYPEVCVTYLKLVNYEMIAVVRSQAFKTFQKIIYK